MRLSKRETLAATAVGTLAAVTLGVPSAARLLLLGSDSAKAPIPVEAAPLPAAESTTNRPPVVLPEPCITVVFNTDQNDTVWSKANELAGKNTNAAPSFRSFLTSSLETMGITVTAIPDGTHVKVCQYPWD